MRERKAECVISGSGERARDVEWSSKERVSGEGVAAHRL